MAVYLYSPVIKSHADTQEGNSVVNTNVGAVIGLVLSSNEVAMAASINSFVHNSVTAAVSTNSQYGYTLTIEDADANTNMTHLKSGITDAIAAISSKQTSGEMSNNTWGYSTDNTNYYGIPALGSPVAIKRTLVPLTTVTEETTVDFGVKVGTLTSGTYQDTVLFTAYPNGADGNPEDGTPVSDPDDGSSDGEMQSFSCSSLTNVGDSATLADARDGNTYTVKKLADGKCWMTQNLRIANEALTSSDSDLSSGGSWTVPASDIYSFSDSMNYGVNDFNQNNAYVNSYGGYYSFYSATAGWGTGGWYGEGVSSGNSPRSICPYGWRLPTNSEFETLYDSYGSSDSAMMGEPGFVLSGSINNGEEYHQGENASYWASTVESTDYAHFFYFTAGSGITHPDYYSYKGGGYSVRCVAR